MRKITTNLSLLTVREITEMLDAIVANWSQIRDLLSGCAYEERRPSRNGEERIAHKVHPDIVEQFGQTIDLCGASEIEPQREASAPGARCFSLQLRVLKGDNPFTFIPLRTRNLPAADVMQSSLHSVEMQRERQSKPAMF